MHRLGGRTADTQYALLQHVAHFSPSLPVWSSGYSQVILTPGRTCALCIIAYTWRTSCSNISMRYRWSGGRLGRASAISQRQCCSIYPRWTYLFSVTCCSSEYQRCDDSGTYCHIVDNVPSCLHIVRGGGTRGEALRRSHLQKRSRRVTHRMRTRDDNLPAAGCSGLRVSCARWDGPRD
jgi:hypothetical protein